MTIIEKILARRAGLAKVSPGDLIVVDVDIAILIDNAFFPSGWREVLKVVHPERVVVVFDHRAPAPDRFVAAAHQTGRDFAKRFGITRVHDGGRDAGISHVIAAEHGYALPGSVLVCADSHTCSSGALNCGEELTTWKNKRDTMRLFPMSSGWNAHQRKKTAKGPVLAQPPEMGESLAPRQRNLRARQLMRKST